jgi:hypothetical protein
MWPSEKFASSLYDWANIALIVALVLGAISTVLIVWMGNVKDEYLNVRLANTAERAARAEQSAAEANKVAEQERLARMKIEQQLAPRSITPSESADISHAVRAYGTVPVDIFVADPSPEAAGLTAILSAALSAGGWVPMSWTWTGVESAAGISIAYEPGASFETFTQAAGLNEAFTNAGLKSAVGPWPGDWKQFGGMLNGPPNFDPTRASIRIIVGAKP